MIKISIIEKLIPLTKTFSLRSPGVIEIPELLIDFSIYSESLNFVKMIYPLFLQEVIEGINETAGVGIFQTNFQIQIMPGVPYYFRYNPQDANSFVGCPTWCASIIAAKEKVILHWWENIRNET